MYTVFVHVWYSLFYHEKQFCRQNGRGICTWYIPGVLSENLTGISKEEIFICDFEAKFEFFFSLWNIICIVLFLNILVLLIRMKYTLCLYVAESNKMRWFESGYQLLYDRYLLHMISTHFIIVSTLIWNMVCMHHPTHHCINMTNLATSVVYCCCCFSACSTKEKEHWLVWNLGNVSDWGNMSTSRLLFQWANTMKIKLNVLV